MVFGLDFDFATFFSVVSRAIFDRRSADHVVRGFCGADVDVWSDFFCAVARGERNFFES